MASMISLDIGELTRPLADMETALGAASRRFLRRLDAQQRKSNQPRPGGTRTRLPAMQVGKPVSHPLILPPKLRTRIPMTVVQRDRILHPSTPPAPIAGLQRGIHNLADRLRQLPQRIGEGIQGQLGRRDTRRPGRVMTQRYSFGPAMRLAESRAGPRLLHELQHTAVRAMVLVMTAIVAGMLLQVQHQRTLKYVPPKDLEATVSTMAEAIAVAEGYYARGEHEGHSLPYRLHNPGSLKKPTLKASDLPTWKGSGLVVFPNEEMGWAALRHQVRLMLTGGSSIYDVSDTFLEVARKYAEGDLNWGYTVASKLGVSPHATLADLLPGSTLVPQLADKLHGVEAMTASWAASSPTK